MRFTFTGKSTLLAAACALTLGAVHATAQDIDENGLVKDASGRQVMSGFGVCVHSGFGPAPSWTAGCHPRVSTPMAQYLEKTIPVPLTAVVYETVGFDANVLFDSNKSNLRKAGRDSLDAFVGKINGLEGQSMLAIGYSDRVGSGDANQILSQERVDTVKAYLVSQGVAANRVATSARGERQPTTWATACKDAINPKNVACMQSDRHVYIEISGSTLEQGSRHGNAGKR